jgi:hypothetical protein
MGRRCRPGPLIALSDPRFLEAPRNQYSGVEQKSSASIYKIKTLVSQIQNGTQLELKTLNRHFACAP